MSDPVPLPAPTTTPTPLPRELKPLHWAIVMAACLFVQVALAFGWALISMLPPLLSGARPEKPEPGPAMLLVLQSVDFAIAIGGAWWFACRRLGLSLRAGLDVHPTSRRIVLFSIGAGIFCLAAKEGLVAIDPSAPPEMLMKLIDTPAGFYSFALLGLLSPIFEEIYYRGFMFRALENGAGTGAAATIVTIWFVALHVPQYWPSAGAIASILVLSLTTTLLRVRTGSIVPGMIAHAVYNWIVIAIAIVARHAG